MDAVKWVCERVGCILNNTFEALFFILDSGSLLLEENIHRKNMVHECVKRICSQIGKGFASHAVL